jgi:Glyoxalase/Bleomycin resistance protein/Dioxygenase superfamily
VSDGHSERPALQQADLFHTGIVVDDLDAGKKELGKALGLTWREGGAAVRMLTDEGARTVRTGYALSREGPHHVELVQSIEGTLWAASAPGYSHHLGYWVDDVAATSAALVRLDYEWLASIAIADEAPPMCAYHAARNGLCVEIVDRAMRPVLLPRD